MHPFPEGLQDSFKELRRRRLARILGAYVFIAWLAVQIADILFPALFLPEWSVRLVLVIAVTGLPCALVLAWATDGERRQPGALATLRDWGIAAAVLGVIAFVVARGAGGPPDGLAGRIAVLPFADVSREGDQRYLGDGIAGELLDRLARVDGLRLVSRTSSFAYRDRQADPGRLMLARYTPSAYLLSEDLEAHQVANAGLLLAHAPHVCVDQCLQGRRQQHSAKDEEGQQDKQLDLDLNVLVQDFAVL